MTREFYVEEELCTSCGDCYKALPQYFQDTGNDSAEVHNMEVKPDEMPKLEKVMKECPGKAILWRK
jgi:ferredoxin